jgi:hypothetical protein
MFDEVDVEKSKWNSKGRNTIFNIVKKKTGVFWPRLVKDTKKDSSIKVEFKIIEIRLIGISGSMRMRKRKKQEKIGIPIR